MFKPLNSLFIIVFVCLLFAALDSKKINKNTKKDQGKEAKVKKDVQKVREVRSIKSIQNEKQPKENYQETLKAQTQTVSEVPQQAYNNVQHATTCPEAVQVPIQQTSVIKVQKVKAIHAMTEYELCKQECRRKRDMESTKEYVDVLREELHLAERQLQIQREKEILEQAIANATAEAENKIKLTEKTDVV